MYQAKILNPKRKEFWVKALGTDTVPVVSPYPTKENLPGLEGKQDVFFLNLTLLSEDQIGGVCALMSENFNIPLKEVQSEIYGHGVPILAKDIIVKSVKEWPNG